jgi:uncharacterized protein with GYD domain
MKRVGRSMPHYVSLVKWTDQGIKNIKDSPKRAEGAKKAAEGMGGKMWLWYTMGKFDLVAISEFPDDESAQKFLYWLGSMGNVRTTTMRAWNEEGAAKLIGQLP